ncbi:hypothetical protein EWK57_24695, partial [Escherichia coli]
QLTSTVETNKSNYTVGETITITVTLRDAFDNLVTGAASQLAAVVDAGGDCTGARRLAGDTDLHRAVRLRGDRRSNRCAVARQH